jgi:hypothetical protein
MERICEIIVHKDIELYLVSRKSLSENRNPERMKYVEDYLLYTARGMALCIADYAVGVQF